MVQHEEDLTGATAAENPICERKRELLLKPARQIVSVGLLYIR